MSLIDLKNIMSLNEDSLKDLTKKTDIVVYRGTLSI